VGIISKTCNIGAPLQKRNEFFEFGHFTKHRTEQLNLLSFEAFQQRVENAHL